METKQIKIDTSFPGYYDDELRESLASGWHILDKTILKDRYIVYTLVNKADPDVGKNGTPPTNL